MNKLYLSISENQTSAPNPAGATKHLCAGLLLSFPPSVPRYATNNLCKCRGFCSWAWAKKGHSSHLEDLFLNLKQDFSHFQVSEKWFPHCPLLHCTVSLGGVHSMKLAVADWSKASHCSPAPGALLVGNFS